MTHVTSAKTGRKENMQGTNTTILRNNRGRRLENHLHMKQRVWYSRVCFYRTNHALVCVK